MLTTAAIAQSSSEGREEYLNVLRSRYTKSWTKKEVYGFVDILWCCTFDTTQWESGHQFSIDGENCNVILNQL
ncbi:hypothetical protein V3C99_001328 [Haemonchus contortus]